MSDFTLYLIKSLNYNFVVDEKSTTKDFVVFRTKFSNSEEVHSFVRELENLTNSNYNVRLACKNMRRKIFRKVWICRLSQDRKKPHSTKSADCKSFIDVCIKKVNRSTQRNDHFLKKDPLPCVIKMNLEHTHSTDDENFLRKLRIAPEIKKKFYQYFGVGLNVPEAKKIHQSQLLSCYDPSILINGAINPTDHQLYYIHEKWKAENPDRTFDSFGKPADVSNISIQELIPFINKNFKPKILNKKDSSIDSLHKNLLQKKEDEDSSNKEISANGQKEHLEEEESNISCSETVSSQGESITIVDCYSLSSNQPFYQPSTFLPENVPNTFSETSKGSSEINFTTDHKSFSVKEDFTFKYLLDNLSHIIKPNDFWGLSSHSDVIICARWNENFTCAKKVVIENSLILRVFLDEWEINLSEFMNIRCIGDICKVLEKVENAINHH